MAVACSPDGRWIASGGYGTEIGVWNRATRSTERMIESALDPSALIFSPDSRRLAAWGWPGSLRFWDVETGTPGPIIEARDGNTIEGVAFHPTGNEIVTAERVGIRIRDGATGTVVREFSRQSGSAVAISGDGRLLAVATLEGTLRIHRYATGVVLHSWQGHSSNCRAIAFSPDARLLASGSADGTICLWDVETGMPLRVTLPLLGSRSATITPAGQLMMDPAAAEEEIACVVQEQAKGPVELLTPREFHARFRSSLPKPDRR
jgi:WD40 repeat protein